MRRYIYLLLLPISLSVLSAQPAPSIPVESHGAYKASNGGIIKLNVRRGTFVTPYSPPTELQDCSDDFQVCITDHHGFSFAYFANCNDAESDKYRLLKFPPKIVSLLHNTDVWMVSDAAPQYLIHYAYSKGIVGIYIGQKGTIDFRSVFKDRDFRLTNLSSMEFHLEAGSGTIAACKP